MYDKLDLQTGADPEFGFYTIVYSRGIKGKNVCYFAGHTWFSEYPDYLYYYLEKIVDAGFEIIFISSSLIPAFSLGKLQSTCPVIIEKENKGVDFGAWKVGLSVTDYGKQFDSILLTNDSIIGPFFDLQPIFEKFTTSQSDFYGITRSLQRGEHIQSYFIFVSNRVILSDVWKEFWSNLLCYQRKDDVVDKYEIHFTKKLLLAGFQYEIWSDWQGFSKNEFIKKKILKNATLFKYWASPFSHFKEEFNENINPCSFYWEELITLSNFPFIKRELIIFKTLNTEYSVFKNWKYPVSNTGYRIDLISQILSLGEIRNAVKSAPLNTEKYEFHYYHTSASPHFSNFILLFNEKTFINKKYHSYLSIRDKSSGKEFIFNFIYLSEENVDDLIEKNDRISPVIHATGKNVYNLVLPFSNDAIPYLYSLSIPQTILFNNFEEYESAMLRFIQQVVPDSWCVENAYSPLITNNAIDISDLKNMEFQFAEPGGSSDQKPESENFFETLNKYHREYETLPMWYKKIGQVFKILMGHKILTMQIKSKSIKLSLKHKITVDHHDKINFIRNWYYHEYDVLPGWYKKFGKLINKKK
jgi:hypothetical protein